MPKKKETEEIIEKIQEYAIDEIMEIGFGRYSKEIIQERALPDVRDGLKPVQRRILYGMKKSGYSYDKPYRKSAKAVGEIMGNFHPHGDSSIYDALIRMSQPWKMREVFVDIHGNNGSIDGDGAAAMRYTEARLSKIAETMLESINKNTVEMTYNFDDTELEPTVLPARFPNLLVNGSTGISAGYATDIPTHNLSEVIDATVKRIESPNCRLETIMDIMPGPDFPTGGVIEGKEELIKAYTTGKGKVVLKADCEIINEKGKNQIIVKSIPYDLVKEVLIKKIIDIKIDKKVDGINDVIDESDHENMARIVIDLKKEADANLILNYLYKNTDLQVNYNFNMVAIVNRRPKYVGVLDILDAFIAHQKDVVTRRTEFDLRAAKDQLHILEGLVKAISILDEVIKVIRASKNKSDAIENLVKEFKFNELQAKAIVELQLYRLTNTDIVELQDKMKELKEKIAIWEQILSNEDALKHVMVQELKQIKKEYGNPRRTIIKDEVTEIKLDMKAMIKEEDVVVFVTNDGYLKRVSKKAYAANEGEMPTLKPGDYVTQIFNVSTLDNILIFTNLGNYLFIPVHILQDSKYKEIGKHVNNIISGLSSDEKVVNAIVLDDETNDLTLFTKNGLVKRTQLSEFVVTRYSKAMLAFKLKDKDEVISVKRTRPNTLFVTKGGKYLNIKSDEISVVGARASGVKGIGLTDDEVICGLPYDDTKEYLTVVTNKKTAKRVKISDLELHNRAKKGSNIIKKVKSNDYQILTCLLTNSKDNISLIVDGEISNIKNSDVSIMDLNSTGSAITKKNVTDAILEVELQDKKVTKKVNASVEEKKEEEVKKEEVKEEKKEEFVQTSLDDFYQDFKL
ncbi:MAG: DNA topoisomerase IV subunit A [Firmicutes bacterium]|nr:DNA topoisomerase IV subunit A [Bacillota bacterium]